MGTNVPASSDSVPGRVRKLTSVEHSTTRELTLALAGDVMLGRLMNDVLAAEGPAYPWGDTLPLLRTADLTIVNLECVISDRGTPWQRTPKVFHFRAAPIALDAIDLAGVDAVSLANNHVLDYEEDALLDMLRRLRERGIAYAGAGRDLVEATRPALVARDGLRLALVSFTDNEPDWAAGPSHPGTHYLPITTSEPVRQHVAACIAEARSFADFVVISVHWGPNMVLRPPPHHRAFAHMTIDAGADLVFGHSAHLFQGIEWYRGRPILYDAGDFVDDYAVDPIRRNDWALLFLVTLGRSRRPGDAWRTPPGSTWTTPRITLVPLLISNFQVNQATGDDHAGIVHRATLLCGELGTRLERIGAWLTTEPPTEMPRAAAG